MEHIVAGWEDIAERVRNARRILVMSDFDGTLAPIALRPEEATIPERTKELLQALAEQPRVAIGIISGRALDDLRSKVGVEGVTYAGNHGLEIEGPGVVFVSPAAETARSVVQNLHRDLSRALAGIGGVVIEDKRLTLSVHYRLVDPEKIDHVKSVFDKILGGTSATARVRTTVGKKVLEVRPDVDWDKGKAISLLLDRQDDAEGEGEVLPVFLGDDVTDVDGFSAVEERGGISVFVGDEVENRIARYYLRSPAEVEQFLRRLLDLIEAGDA